MSEDIRSIGTINRLITYFSKVLDWQIDEDDFEDIEDISYDFEAKDLGLKEEAFAKIKSLRQLQPLVDGQKWGIFSIEFDSKKFEVTALRKVLSGLIPKKRNSADHAVWDQKDLLFLCFWGEDSNRTIGIAHFEEKEKGLPQIKMIYCAPAIEDTMQIRQFEARLKNLAWPLDVQDVQKWHDDWSSAFSTGYRQIIHDASTLTLQLAVEARGIRNRILETLEVETDKGYVHQLYEKFKDTLIHDMTEVQFADMYAQTVVYGLFSARCMDESQDDFSATEAVECIPNTNPFLKSLMKECLGAKNNSKLSYDELEIGNVVDLLLHTKTDAIIQDFNRQTGGGKEDPVIHFYEEFLTAYDKNQKVQRGVYYTPQPVVNFIVRAVDSIIKNEFGLSGGIASTDTKKVKYMRESKIRKQGLYRTQVEDVKEVPAIQILDPSTGTGTFLRQTILQIFENYKEDNNNLSESEFTKSWNEYVSKDLLPRINGFELMMAPYAVAHMKLAMVLKDTGYEFGGDERLRVYLVNTLEKPGNADAQLSIFDDPIASESIEANSVKKNSGINIIIGNPPYSGESANKGQWIMSLMEDYKMEPGGRVKLQEKNPKWINDDYVKFIKYAQSVIDKTGMGILSYICPHGFIDNPTFRGMRWNLLNSFSKVYILDLHGNAKKGEMSPDGSKDENVFDIQQGVCILICVKKGTTSGLAEVYHCDLYGLREYKYEKLGNSTFSDIQFEKVDLQEPQFFFVPKDFSNSKEYNGDGFFNVDKLLTLSSVGFVSARDKLCIQDSKEEMKTIADDFSTLDIEVAREKYKLGKDVRDWRVCWAQEDINNNRGEGGKLDTTLIRAVNYRPFDEKYTYYTGKSKGFHCYPRFEVMKNLMTADNIALCLNKVVKTGETYQHCFVSNKPIDACFVSNKTSEITYAFPLFSVTEGFRVPNLDNTILKEFERRLGEKCSETGVLNPMSIFSYIYGCLNIPRYREKFIEFLKIGFPRVPFPEDINSFLCISQKGKELIDVQIQYKSIKIEGVNKPESGVVKKVEWKNGRVYFNDSSFFEVGEKEWNYKIGCYQVLDKWLKDRKGINLNEADIENYMRIIFVINKTIEIQQELDNIMEM